MQEYVEERTIAISVKAAKLSGKVLAAACKKVFAEIAKQQEAAKRPKGRQSVRKLMNHHGGKNAMKYVGAPKDFDRIAKEFHVDYAFHKTGPGHYLLFSRQIRPTLFKRLSANIRKRSWAAVRIDHLSSVSFDNS